MHVEQVTARFYATCAKCGEPNGRNHAYCRPCHALNMRDYRRKRATRIEALQARVDALMAAASGMCTSCSRRARREALIVELVTLTMRDEAAQ